MSDPKIELRSRKARSIVGKMPPRIIMHGTGVLFLVFALLILLALKLPFRNAFEAKAVLQLTDGEPIYHIFIPVNRISELQLPQKVVLTSPDGLANWEARVYRVSDTITIFDNTTVQIAFACIVEKSSQNSLNVILNPSFDTVNVHINGKLQTIIGCILSK